MANPLGICIFPSRFITGARIKESNTAIINGIKTNDNVLTTAPSIITEIIPINTLFILTDVFIPKIVLQIQKNLHRF